MPRAEPADPYASLRDSAGDRPHRKRSPHGTASAGDSRVDGLASGIYIVRLSNEITKKVIIR
ncbi:MAG: T9SS type A sorting domain-containing protein [Parabacteroides distasonis]